MYQIYIIPPNKISINSDNIYGKLDSADYNFLDEPKGILHKAPFSECLA